MGIVQESYNVQDRQIVNLNDMQCLECSLNVISAVALVCSSSQFELWCAKISTHTKLQSEQYRWRVTVQEGYRVMVKDVSYSTMYKAV